MRGGGDGVAALLPGVLETVTEGAGGVIGLREGKCEQDTRGIGKEEERKDGHTGRAQRSSSVRNLAFPCLIIGVIQLKVNT